MTLEEFELLCTDEVQRAIAAARGRDPLEVALDRAVPHARLVATQVKYLARAERKLPTYAAAQCLLPPRAFEQASSEACAAHKRIEGAAVLDLTCGLGVDALFLSRRFGRVVALERDPALARVAVWNFARLGARNIEVVCASAEEYLSRPGLRFDWVYADPDRRTAQGRRAVRLEECSPDVLALGPSIARASARLCLKNSPLFDVAEALRLYPDACVEVVSLGDECKEVVVRADGTGPSVTATALGLGSCTARPEELRAAGTLSQRAAESGVSGSEPSESRSSESGILDLRPSGSQPDPGPFDPERYRWLVIPDVALQKARLARLHLRGKADIWSDGGYGFAVDRPEGVLGRVEAIECIESYDPKRLKRAWRGCGAQVLKRDFPIAVEELMRRLGLHPGAELRVAFTKIGNDFWAIRLK